MRIPLLACLLISLLVAGTADVAKPTGKTPIFTTRTMAGTAVTQASLAKSGPAVLVFIGTNCPVTNDLYKHYDKLYRALSAKGISVYAVVDAKSPRAKEFAKTHKTAVPMLLDPGLKVFRAFGLFSSPASAVLGRDGKVARLDKGCSLAALQSTVASAAALKGVKVIKPDFKGAPASLTHG